MKIMYLIIAQVLLCDGFFGFADDASSSGRSDERPYSVTTNNAVLIQNRKGEKAIVQFTSFTRNGGFYRWRFSGVKSTNVQSGVGAVLEDYKRVPSPRGSGDILTPTHDNNTWVKAGNISIEWSYGSLTNGWIYLPSENVQIKILDASDFSTALEKVTAK